MPKVSVVIPAFNTGNCLEEAISSVLAQTYVDYEVIIVNDGSTDQRTLDILDHYAACGLRVITTPNRGPSAARNTGIREAKGEFILTLDSDDKFEPEFLTKAVPILESDSAIGVVGCWYRTFGTAEDVRRPPGGELRDFLVRGSCPASALFRKQCWVDAGGYDESIRQGYEDWDFWLSVTAKGWTVKIIPEVLFRYRVQKRSRFVACRNNRMRYVRCVLSKHEDALREHALYVCLGKEELIAEKDEVIECIVSSRPYRIGSIVLYLLRPLKHLHRFYSRFFRH